MMKVHSCSAENAPRNANNQEREELSKEEENIIKLLIEIIKRLSKQSREKLFKMLHDQMQGIIVEEINETSEESDSDSESSQSSLSVVGSD